MLEPKIAPWAHQREDLDASWEMPAAMIPWPPRLGKSKLAVDTAARLAYVDRIDAVVVVAPNGVHLNWTRREIPKHWPLPDPVVIEWSSGQSRTVRFRRILDEAIKHDGIVWLSINIEAIATKGLVNLTGRGGMGWLEKFVRRRRCLLIVDESHKAKNPKAQRTKALFKIAEHCPYRRCLTGTPSAQGPFDLWSQYFILDPDILGRRYRAFRYRYGVFRPVRYGTGPLHDELVEYRNLDELNRRMDPYRFVRRKEDCLDLPARLMREGSEVLGIPQYFEMPPEHRRVYNELRDDLVARLSSGEEMTAAHALTNLLRLQQISRGTAVLEDGTVVELDGPSPAVDSTVELVAGHDGKAIVWCRFVSDVDHLVRGFTDAGIGCIRCDGTVPSQDRPALVDRFRDDPSARVWVGTLATGGEGIDLGSATLMVFFSHGFDLVQRVQGLERNYGSSQTADRVAVVDLIAADSVDERALLRLEDKDRLASMLSGRGLKEILDG